MNLLYMIYLRMNLISIASKKSLFLKKFFIDNYIFWPDSARAHYSKETQVWLNGKVTYVFKHLNPPNVQQARTTENFWGCLAQKVYEVGWEANTEQELRRRISSKQREIYLKFF